MAPLDSALALSQAAGPAFPWFGWFLLTGFWLWASVIFWVVLTFVCVEHEYGGRCFLLLLVFAVLLHVGGQINLVGLVKTDPWHLAMYIGGYFLGGLLWSMKKWNDFTGAIVVRINEYEIPRARQEFITTNAIEGDIIPDVLTDKYKQFVEEKIAPYKADLTFKNNWREVTFWATWWPFSFFWWLLSDWFKKAWRWLVTKVFAKIYEAISNRQLGKIKIQ